MKFYKNYAPIIIILFTTLTDEVQGKSNEKSLGIAVDGGEESSVSQFQTKENNTKNNYLPTHSKLTKVTKKLYHFKKAKTSDIEIYGTAKNLYQENKNNKTQIRRSFPAQKIYCRQTTRSEVNAQGEIIESIQHTCAPLSTTTDNRNYLVAFRPSVPAFRNLITSTPKGINCRRVMNSELNDLGEIIDTVTEVCDTPTTTTTTTKKPVIHTTPKITTTTPKPLVKVCRPVMNSYLNEEGKIIDSVNIFCRMEQPK